MTDEAWQRLAGAVRVRRRRLGLTQSELAAAAGVSEPTIRVLETARRKSYQPNTMRDVARALDWPDDALHRILAGEGPEAVKPLTPDQEERLMTLERELADLREHLGLPPRKRPNGGPQSETA